MTVCPGMVIFDAEPKLPCPQMAAVMALPPISDIRDCVEINVGHIELRKIEMLYRGVDEITDQQNKGRLVPKGGNVEVVARFDGKWRHDGKIKLGPCQSNTARAHQIESGLYGGCGISTTRKEDKAVFFATTGNMVDGYVYVIDENLLEKANIQAHEFEDPEYPHEFEVTLIEKNGGEIPLFVVVEKYAVSADGARK